MSLQRIHLRKLLKIMYAEGVERVRFLRSDIREDMARERGGEDGGDGSGGGDFYAPFWRDAKDHVYGYADLHDATAARIVSNSGRRNLYPQLRDGFLVWWNERRRWTNAPFEPIAPPTMYFSVPSTDTTVKVGGILAVRDGRRDDHFIYPYWFPAPLISEEAGRVGLWVLAQALPRIDPGELRILDVIRGQSFALDRTPFVGDEHRLFIRRYTSAVADWNRLRAEYE